jgi:heme/copper-type cytochrome/quinol oxidase subunit 1
MKKIIAGSFMLLSGTISSAILMAATMLTGTTYIDDHQYMDILSDYGLQSVFHIFVAIAVVGLALLLWGLIEGFIEGDK